MESARQPITVRPLRADEERLYMEIVNSAILGLARSHYSPDAIAGWVVPINEETLGNLARNEEHEIRLIAELDGEPVGIGALILERSELRACYVSPKAARRGCGSALVREIERLALENGLTRLELAGSLNAEPFYAAHGYHVRERSDVVLRNGYRMAAVWMEKNLQTWDPANYSRTARFVSDLGAPVLELLAPRPGERILDLGCGDGVLTKQLVDHGCQVVGIDSSPAQIEAARTHGLDAHVMAAEDLPFQREFDAVFSNAVLHWIKRADPMLAAVQRALRPGGRFVAECGGYGCVDQVRTALVGALNRRGIDGEARVPWYFPTPADYQRRLERAGFHVNSIALIPRPTPLPGDIIDWLETFAQSFFHDLPPEARSEYLHEVRALLEPQLRDATGIWVADYVRLRFVATAQP
ncbi:MAG TPA: GNAT family N-acetyltransferase [Vicinamibacterales bacterium]|jgi:trans-aconitate methyltransferase/N-acetylglutamate synthase-like GNAT family acetyltransferase